MEPPMKRKYRYISYQHLTFNQTISLHFYTKMSLALFLLERITIMFSKVNKKHV